MHLFILRWNPAISSYKTERHLKIIDLLTNNKQPANLGWSIREHEKLEKNDLFILQQVGTDHDGIAMIGKFKDISYEADSWRDDGSRLHYADLWIMDAFDCESENPLSANRYETLFPEIEWHQGHSGVIVEENLDDKLINQIEKDLINAGKWETGDLDRFVTYDFEKNSSNANMLFTVKDEYMKNPSQENFISLVNCLSEAKVLIPMHVEKDENGENNCFPIILTNDTDEVAYQVFSNEEQIGDNYKNDDCEFYEIPVTLCIEIAAEDPKSAGIILDPFTTPFEIDKELSEIIINESKSDEENNEE